MPADETWLNATLDSLAGYRQMIDATVSQLTDEQFVARPRSQINSVAVLLRHLGGNLQSRWTNFLTEDGEKASRQRDQEFEDWQQSREALLAHFDLGWQCLHESLASLKPEDWSRTVTIRGESHTVQRAVQRTLTHIAYHVGQLVMVARLVYDDDESWQWLTVPPGGSQAHNESTWGTSASRSVAGLNPDDVPEN